MTNESQKSGSYDHIKTT